jgi:hypothetical protein
VSHERGRATFWYVRQASLCASDLPCDNNATAAVLLFNMGLLHHQEGIITNASLACTRSVQFHQQTISLILLCQKQGNGHTSTTLSSLFAATLHNLAHCHAIAVLDQAEAANYHGQLSHLLHWQQHNGVVVSILLGSHRCRKSERS